MRIEKIEDGRRRYMELLLLADEQESMIERYIDRGEMFVGREGEEDVAVCVVTREGEGEYEIKNLAVRPDCQRRGHGREMIEYVREFYGGECRKLSAGTGDSPLTVPFYERCGFSYSHRVKGFFTENYDHEITECGRVLEDMLYFSMERDESAADKVQDG